jgi:hypothetical protein
MSDIRHDPSNPRAEEQNCPKKVKKSYEKPSFQHERVFETMALACGKISPTQFQCRFNRKNS